MNLDQTLGFPGSVVSLDFFSSFLKDFRLPSFFLEIRLISFVLRIVLLPSLPVVRSKLPLALIGVSLPQPFRNDFWSSLASPWTSIWLPRLFWSSLLLSSGTLRSRLVRVRKILLSLFGDDKCDYSPEAGFASTGTRYKQRGMLHLHGCLKSPPPTMWQYLFLFFWLNPGLGWRLRRDDRYNSPIDKETLLQDNFQYVQKKVNQARVDLSCQTMAVQRLLRM